MRVIQRFVMQFLGILRPLAMPSPIADEISGGARGGEKLVWTWD
jgi:hypothetical protein